MNHIDSEDSIYNQSFLDLKESLPELSTIMSSQFQDNQNIEYYQNYDHCENQFSKSFSVSSRKIINKHQSEENEREQNQGCENQLLKYIVKSVQKYVSDLQISEKQSCTISSIQISQQKRAMNRSPQFGVTKYSVLQVSDIKKSIIQNLFIIKQDLKQDQDEIASTIERKNLTPEDMYKSRKKNDKSSSNQLEGLSSIGQKQQICFQNIEVEEFDLKNSKKNSPKRKQTKYQQRNLKLKQIHHKQIADSSSSNKILNEQSIQNDEKKQQQTYEAMNQTMKKSIQSIIMDEQFINAIVPQFAINKIQHHRFPSFSKDLRIRFLEMEKSNERKLNERKQRIRNNFLNVIGAGLKLRIYGQKNKKTQNMSLVIQPNAEIIYEAQNQSQKRCLKKPFQKQISYHRLNYSRKILGRHAFSIDKKANQNIGQQRSRKVQDNGLKQFNQQQLNPASVSVIKHNIRGISLMKKTLFH